MNDRWRRRAREPTVLFPLFKQRSDDGTLAGHQNLEPKSKILG